MTASLRELFEQASALPASERAAWLAANCPDAELRTRVEAVLAADAAGTTTPQRDPLALAEAIGSASPTLEPGARIGPFSVEALLGEGGSSAVYRAHRDLDGVRQTVALKVLRRGLHAPEARRQFDRERQALAQLQHPHIAQFIDGGVDPGGTGWLALEFVDGAPITTYARERALDFRRRIVLMVDVARAVAAAHRSLIVHRDLKPGNIFVTTDGHAKLLDFGIAKLLAEDTTDATQTQFRAFTPAYAAPEQRHGGAITTATDVYALGIVLGELVTGQRLTEGGTATPSSRITEDTAPGVLPAEPRLTRRLVKGDLDNILMKALEEEPERRYATAAAFADDLERLLDGRPVSAHPPSGWYRAKKFVQRHRGGVAITALLSLAVIVSLGVAVWQGREARMQAELAREALGRAQSELDRANAMRDFMFDAFAEAEPAAAGTPAMTVADVAERSVEKLQDDPTIDLRTRVELTTELAYLLQNQGQAPRGDAILQRIIAESAAGLGKDHILTLRAERQAVGNALVRENMIQARERVDRLLPRLPEADLELRMEALGNSAMIAEREGDATRALADSALKMELAEKLGDPEQIRTTRYGNAIILSAFGRAAEAIPAIEEEVRLTEEQFGGEHPRTARPLAVLSRTYRRVGRLDEATELARRAYEISVASYPDSHQMIAINGNAYTVSLCASRRFDECARVARQLIERATRLGTTDGAAEFALGTSLAGGEDYAGARAAYQRALADYERTLPPNHPRLIEARIVTAHFAALAGDRATGTASLRQLADAALASTPPQEQWAANAYWRLVRVALHFDDWNGALADLERLDAFAADFERRPGGAGTIDRLRGEALLGMGRVREAREALDRAAAAIGDAERPDPILAIEVPLLRARALAELGEIEAARADRRIAAAGLANVRSPPSRFKTMLAALPQ